jgi:hypothetical protein
MSQIPSSQLEIERAWAAALCRVSPLLGVAVGLLMAKYLLLLIYLKPPGALNDADSFHWKPGIMLGLCVSALPWIWLWSIDLQRKETGPKLLRNAPVAAMLSLAWVGMTCAAFSSQTAVWRFVEWAKIRTPNSSFARNTLQWEIRDFEQGPTIAGSAHLVGLLGSSQMNLGTDLDLLSRHAPGLRFEKMCLAGFGPLQYLWLKERFIERRFDTIVCWLSEFDFFREDELPVNRLRWAANMEGCRRLWHAVDRPVFAVGPRILCIQQGLNWTQTANDHWEFRGDYADLALAALIPLWRHRDHMRRVAFNYWWNASLSSPVPVTISAESQLLIAQENLRQNIGRKRLVDANFLAFEQFVRTMKEHQIDVIVCEGTTHPLATAVYDDAFRIETRNRLAKMAETVGFTYFESSQMPQFTKSDFADPYHLNDEGRTRFSVYLAEILRRRANSLARLRSPQQQLSLTKE